MNIKKAVQGGKSQIHYISLLLSACFGSCKKSTLAIKMYITKDNINTIHHNDTFSAS